MFGQVGRFHFEKITDLLMFLFVERKRLWPINAKNGHQTGVASGSGVAQVAEAAEYEDEEDLDDAEALQKKAVVGASAKSKPKK